MQGGDDSLVVGGNLYIQSEQFKNEVRGKTTAHKVVGTSRVTNAYERVRSVGRALEVHFGRTVS
jgi:hypothetical protein